MPGTVTSQLTNVTLAEAADSTLWDDIGGGQGSTQNTDLPIQGTETRARRIDNATNVGFSFDNTTGIDLSASNTHVGWWLNVLQPNAVTVASLILGNSTAPLTSPWSEWDAFDSTTRPYPPLGGWQRVWIDPTVTRSDGGGTLNLTTVRQFGLRATIADVGGNAQNVHLDRIDYINGGGGLLIDAGTVGSPGTFQDLLDADEGTSANSYGVVFSRDGVVFCLARITIGDATTTVFTDPASALIFADQPLVSSTFMGVTVDLQASGTAVDISGSSIRSGGATNLGDFIVTGTTGTCDVSGTAFDRLRTVELTEAVTATSCVFRESGVIVPNGADLSGSSVSRSTAAAAVLWDAAVDTLGRLDDVAFTSSGTGHAIEFAVGTPSVISLSGQSYTGYAATDGSTGNEVIYNNSAQALTINIVGGGELPTVRNGAGSSTTLVQATSVTLTGLRDNTEVRVCDQATPRPNELAGTENATDGTTNARTFAFSLASGTVVDIVIFNRDFLLPPNNRIENFVIPVNDTTIPIAQIPDRNYRNP